MGLQISRNTQIENFPPQHLRYLERQLKLICRIHSKRQHQQGIVVALIKEDFMWVIGNHGFLKGNKVLSEVDGFFLILSGVEVRAIKRKSINLHICVIIPNRKPFLTI